jgi:HlyD family secretion protein
VGVRAFLVTFIIIFAVLATGAIVGAEQLREALSSLSTEPPRIDVRTETTDETTLVETISAPGEIEPFTKVDISAEVSARITELPFREGATVEKDDVIVRLDDRQLKAQLASSEARRKEGTFRLEAEQARLAGLHSRLAFARKDLERQQSLLATGDVAMSAVDDALERVEDIQSSIDATTSTISVLESSLEVAQAEIDRANTDLEHTVIRAPMAGVITTLNVEVGQAVLGTVSNAGTHIMTIADLSRMILNARVAESDIARVQANQGAKIYVNAYPDIVFDGRVDRIAMQRSGPADGTGHFTTEIEIDLAGRSLYSGLVANVDIEIAAHVGVVVPSQAIIEMDVAELPPEIDNDHPLVDRARETTSVVFRVEEGVALCTPVRTGPSNLTDTLIPEGLDPGERVVTGPYKTLAKIKHRDAVAEVGAGADRQDEDDGAEIEAGEAVAASGG